MWSYRRMTIRGKLVALSMATTGMAIWSDASRFSAYDYQDNKQTLAEELLADATIVGSNSTASISFNDPEAAATALTRFPAQPKWRSRQFIHPTAMCWRDMSARDMTETFQKSSSSTAFTLVAAKLK